MKPLLVLLPVLMISLLSQAEIYRWTDESGNVIYSDNPQQGAEVVRLPGLTSYSSSPVAGAGSSSTRDEDRGKVSTYTAFKISTPEHDATIRDNTGRVDVSIASTPALRAGDRVVFELDGQQFKVNSAEQTFSEVDRGTHTLKAYIIGADDKPVTDVVSIQFHLKKTSILNKPKVK